MLLKMAPVSSIISVLFWISPVLSQVPGTFINPSPQPQDPKRFGTDPLSGNAVYMVGNLLNITWVPLESDLMTIVMWQVNTTKTTSQIGDLQYLPGSSNLGTSYYTWYPIGVDGNNANPKFDLSKSNVFYFAFYKLNGLTPLSVTSYFNLTDSRINAFGQLVSPTTSSVMSSTSSTASNVSSSSLSISTTPSSSAESSPTMTSTSPTMTSAPTKDSSSSELSTGVKVGIGLGVSFGGAILIAILTGIYLLLRRKNAGSDSIQAGYRARSTDHNQELPYTVPSPKPRLASNFNGSSAPHELPSCR